MNKAPRLIKFWSWLMAVAGAVLLVGCQSTDKYYWGHYESLVYLSYARPDEVPLPMQIETLQTDILQAAQEGKSVPPGVHAHLGYLYAKAGDKTRATQEFETEKKLYPEAAVLMDRLLINLARK